MQRDLADRARQGDHDAFTALVDGSIGRLYAVACLILRDRDRAHDAVQEALVAAWQGFDGLHDRSRFGPWFDRILVNGCRDRLRRRRIVRFVPIDAEDDRASDDPFQSFIDRDELLAGLHELSPDERVAIVLRFWADLPLEAIGDRLGWPLGTVKSRLHRAVRRLHQALDRESEGATR